MRCATGSHVFSSGGYPSHLTKYCLRRLTTRDPRILSTTYSCSWLSGSIPGGLIYTGVSGSAGSKSDTWNTRYILILGGRSSSKFTGPLTYLILNGPIFIWSNLFEGRVVLIFRFKRYTLSPSLRVGPLSLFLL